MVTMRNALIILLNAPTVLLWLGKQNNAGTAGSKSKCVWDPLELEGDVTAFKRCLGAFGS
jgi:hypothetical protein